MSLHQKRFLERLQWPLWSIVLAVTILLLRSGSEQNGSFGISLETPVHAHPTPVPTPYVTAEPELKDSVYFRKDGQNVNGQTFEVYWEPNKNAAFYRGKAGITVPGPVEYELDTSHWWIGPEEWRFASSAGQGYPVDYCYSIVHSSFPSLNTVILLEQLPLTIVYRVKVEDDEQYGGNNPPSRTNCPIKNVPGSKDETAEHEVRVRVLPPCDCEVSFSGERVFKGSSETSDLIITNRGRFTSCQKRIIVPKPSKSKVLAVPASWGARLYRWRTGRKLQRSEVACSLEVSLRYYGKLERNEAKPNTLMLKRLEKLMA